MKHLTVKQMVQIGILGAMANVLMLIRFPLPFMPPFMDFDLSGIPEIVAVFAMGPLAGVLVTLIKIMLKLLLSGTTTMLTGELQNFILSCAYLLPAGLFYRRNRTRRGFLTGMVAGTLICAVTAVFSNMYLILPFYARVYHLSMEQILAMTQAVNRFVDSELKFILLGVVPFNLIKCGVTTMLAYTAYPAMLRIINYEEERRAISKGH